MSRIGKQPIALPPKVKVEVKGQKVLVEGPKGKLNFDLPQRTSLKVENGNVVVSRQGDDAQAKALHGLSRALVNNMVKGVSEVVNMTLGYSHPINYPIPDQIKVTVEENTKLTIEGPDKQVVGQVASELRSFYPPEPYKGKGVRYVGEHVQRKEGKTVQ
jgi:large subunit ribosomal protein L6